MRQVDVGAELTLAGNKLANPGVTNQTNGALVYELKCGGSCGVSANEYK